MLSETKVQILLALIEAGRITVEDIKNLDYKAEVEARSAAQ